GAGLRRRRMPRAARPCVRVRARRGGARGVGRRAGAARRRTADRPRLGAAAVRGRGDARGLRVARRRGSGLAARRRRRRTGRTRPRDDAALRHDVRRRRARRVPRLRAVDDHGARAPDPPGRAAPPAPVPRRDVGAARAPPRDARGAGRGGPRGGGARRRGGRPRRRSGQRRRGARFRRGRAVVRAGRGARGPALARGRAPRPRRLGGPVRGPFRPRRSRRAADRSRTVTVPASPQRPPLLSARPAGPLPGTQKVGSTGRNLWLHALVLAWFVAEAVLVVVHRFVPEAVWLMVHVLMLGAVSTAILVWSQHFADTMLRRQAPGGRPLHVARLAAHTVGALLVLAGLLTEAWALVVAGGVLVAAGALTHAAVLALQARGALPSRFGGLVRYYVAAAVCLPVGVTFGVLMARGGAGTAAYGRGYVAHVTLNVLGWVGLTVLGTLVLLWPTVLRTRIEPGADAAARRALPVLLAGILVVLAACATGWLPLVAVGAAVVLVGTGTVVRHLVAQGRAAQRGAWGFAAWSLAASVAWFAGSVAAFGVRVAAAPSWAAAQDAVGGLLAPFVVGFAAQVLLGALTYLVPVVLGGGPARRRRTEAVVGAGGLYRVVVANGGLALCLLPLPSWVRVALSLVVFGTFLAFLVLTGRAVVVARRETPAAVGTEAAPPSGTARDDAARAVAARRDAQARRPRAGAVTAAVATLALAVVGGVAADPVAAGVGSGGTSGAAT